MGNKFSPTKAMISLNLAKLGGAEEAVVLQSFGLAKTEQDNLADVMRSILPADHPWFKVAGIEAPENNNGSYLDTYRQRHHILSPGLRNWREDITTDEMEEAKNAVLGYDDSPETARKRRAKAEYRRRNPECWSFTPEFERLQLAAAHDWHWRERLLGQ